MLRYTTTKYFIIKSKKKKKLTVHESGGYTIKWRRVNPKP